MLLLSNLTFFFKNDTLSQCKHLKYFCSVNPINPYLSLWNLQITANPTFFGMRLYFFFYLVLLSYRFSQCDIFYTLVWSTCSYLEVWITLWEDSKQTEVNFWPLNYITAELAKSLLSRKIHWRKEHNSYSISWEPTNQCSEWV